MGCCKHDCTLIDWIKMVPGIDWLKSLKGNTKEIKMVPGIDWWKSLKGNTTEIKMVPGNRDTIHEHTELQNGAGPFLEFHCIEKKISIYRLSINIMQGWTAVENHLSKVSFMSHLS